MKELREFIISGMQIYTLILAIIVVISLVLILFGVDYRHTLITTLIFIGVFGNAILTQYIILQKAKTLDNEM